MMSYSMVRDLIQNGYSTLGHLVDENSCRDLENFTETLPYYVWHNEIEAVNKLPLHDPTSHDDDHYYKAYRFADLLPSDVFRKIISSPILHTIAKEYFGEDGSHLSSVILWKSYPTPKSAIAQQLHRDVCKEKSLAAFIYLNDVFHSNGPHTYIRYSHDDRIFQDALDKAGVEKKLIGEADFHWSPKNIYHFIRALRTRLPGFSFFRRNRSFLSLTYLRDGIAYKLDRCLRDTAPDLVHTHTGKAGSCLLTEPKGVHCGNPIIEGHRTMMSLRWNLGKRKQVEHYDFDHTKPEYHNDPDLLTDIQSLLGQVRQGRKK